MTTMTSRERVRVTLDHREPDRVPLDLGGTRVTSIHPGVLAQLAQRLKISDAPVKVMDVWQMLAWIEQPIVEALGIDVLPVPRLVLDFNMRLDQWRDWRLEDGTAVLMPGNFTPVLDDQGALCLYVNDELVARKATTSPYFDKMLETRMSYEPPPVESVVLPTLSDEELQWRQQWAATLRSNTDKALLGDFGFNLGRWGSYQEWLYQMGADEDYVRAWYERKLECLLKNIQLYWQAVGNDIDIVWLMEDFGTQKGMMIAPGAFERLVAPYYKQLFDWIHHNTAWKIFFHSCGGIYPIIPKLIDCGVDILNPVQTTAAGMDPERLKAQFGRQIVFWGGGIDTQTVLPFGSVEDVTAQVRDRLHILAPGGGFVFATSHNIQQDSPVENVVAMLTTVRQYGGYEH